MKLQRIILITGIVLAISIAGLLVVFPMEKSPAVNASPVKESTNASHSCDSSSPKPVFSLLNYDRNLSHRIHITLSNSSNMIVGEESYLLSPGEYLESKIKTFDKNATHYDLTFTVDGNSTYHGSVNASTLVVQSFDYHNGNKGIIPGILFHDGYACPATPGNDNSGIPSPAKPGERKNKYPEGLVYYSFGIPTLHPNNVGLNTSEELYSLLQRVTNASDEELTPYYYPQGPVLGTGYDLDGTVAVQINKDWDVNRSQVTDMYTIIEKHGEQNGIKSVPCKFLPMGIMRLDLGKPGRSFLWGFLLHCTKDRRRVAWFYQSPEKGFTHIPFCTDQTLSARSSPLSPSPPPVPPVTRSRFPE